jgi:3-methyl-2-oxobutanoate hydroxymethyltransferase
VQIRQEDSDMDAIRIIAVRLHDILNPTFTPPAKFVRRYGDAGKLISDAVQSFREDVISHQYPLDNESYHLSQETQQALETVLARKREMRR